MKRIIMTTALVAVGAGCEVGDDSAVNKRVDALEERVVQLEKRPATPAARPQPQRPDPKQVYFLPVDDSDAFRGARDAKVTIVEAYEFACPYCAMIEPMLSEVVEAYRGTDTLKVVSKQFVVHPQIATPAALATCAAARQEKFEAFSHALWARSWRTEGGRPKMIADGLAREAIVEVAGSVGIDTKRFEADLDSDDCRKKLEKDRVALNQIGVRGTPSLYINGRPYAGARTADGLKSAIEAERKAFESRGLAARGGYAELMKSARRTL